MRGNSECPKYDPNKFSSDKKKRPDAKVSIEENDLKTELGDEEVYMHIPRGFKCDD